MRSELLLLSVLSLAACDEKPAGPAPARFAAVKKSTAAAATAFCDKRYPASGEGVRSYTAPALRSFGAGAARAGKGWTWINVWATWCKPCVEEMGMLNRWREAFTREGLDVTFTLLSIDESSAQPELEAWSKKNLPGAIQWIRSENDVGGLLDGLGVERDSSIPIHALVDPKGHVRCVRVGAIHEQNYGNVRDLVSESP